MRTLLLIIEGNAWLAVSHQCQWLTPRRIVAYLSICCCCDHRVARSLLLIYTHARPYLYNITHVVCVRNIIVDHNLIALNILSRTRVRFIRFTDTPSPQPDYF